MFGHMPELLIILVIALIVFGPEKLPEMAGNVGRAVRDIRQALDVMSNQEDHEVPEDFSSYYYESMARAGEAPEEEEDQKIEDLLLDESDLEAIEAEHKESMPLEPIPFPFSDRPDIFPSQSEMDSLVPDPADATVPHASAPTADQAVPAASAPTADQETPNPTV